MAQHDAVQHASAYKSLPNSHQKDLSLSGAVCHQRATKSPHGVCCTKSSPAVSDFLSFCKCHMLQLSVASLSSLSSSCASFLAYCSWQSEASKARSLLCSCSFSSCRRQRAIRLCNPASCDSFCLLRQAAHHQRMVPPPRGSKVTPQVLCHDQVVRLVYNPQCV